jgi:hypothetical protein
MPKAYKWIVMRFLAWVHSQRSKYGRMAAPLIFGRTTTPHVAPLALINDVVSLVGFGGSDAGPGLRFSAAREQSPGEDSVLGRERGLSRTLPEAAAHGTCRSL